MVTDDLELLIAAVAREAAHYHHCSLATATRQIHTLFAEARMEYRAAGAPYGDDARGFCRWLLARPRLTPAAERDTLGDRQRTAPPIGALAPPLPHHRRDHGRAYSSFQAVPRCPTQ